MAKGGYIKLHRRILESVLYKEPRKFNRSEAWIDILLQANHEDEIQTHYKAEVLIPKGSFSTSFNQLAKRWRWDKKAVMKFLEYLALENMVILGRTKSDPKSGTKKGTIINVVNWGTYQVSGTKTGTKSGTKSDPKKREPSIILKEDKNIYRQIFDFWNEQEIIVHATLTEKMTKAIDKALAKASVDEILIAIERYADVLDDDSYFFSYKWSLDIFLSRANGFTDFLDEGAKWVNYQEHIEQNTSLFPQKKRNFVTKEDLGL